MSEVCETKEPCRQKVLRKVKASLPELIGAVIGAIAGFIYYYKVGCSTGSCPIKSNPWLITLWGAAMGYLLVGIFTTKRK